MGGSVWGIFVTELRYKQGKGGRGEGRLEFGIGTLARLSLLNFLRIVFLLAATETLLYTGF